ncbi:hypothetical protein ONZ51_g3198 [Trametes cubensis]|uniref:Zn(2)-C6 fungal-type domain-containing protein n=1 Tax=Trametes cubensis TaxID=1111947 RepID=A0AAD7TY43_9APHY|nr:hypothetical protein ONZ51_g3198 [Trametes cubensis]
MKNTHVEPAMHAPEAPHQNLQPHQHNPTADFVFEPAPAVDVHRQSQWMPQYMTQDSTGAQPLQESSYLLWYASMLPVNSQMFATPHDIPVVSGTWPADSDGSAQSSHAPPLPWEDQWLLPSRPLATAPTACLPSIMDVQTSPQVSHACQPQTLRISPEQSQSGAHDQSPSATILVSDGDYSEAPFESLYSPRPSLAKSPKHIDIDTKGVLAKGRPGPLEESRESIQAAGPLPQPPISQDASRCHDKKQACVVCHQRKKKCAAGVDGLPCNHCVEKGNASGCIPHVDRRHDLARVACPSRHANGGRMGPQRGKLQAAPDGGVLS